MNQRMFHGNLSAAALADQLAARFNDRQQRVSLRPGPGTTLVQIGSKHGTPVTLNLADTPGGVLVTMSRDRDWLDRAADASELLERASEGSPLSLLAALPEVVGELRKENIAPQIWDAVNEICSLSRQIAGEKNAPQNPVVCRHCQTANPAGALQCAACGAPLPLELPRLCPKCGRAHTADALFCQACGTRLVKG
jgi:hypothetical protein